MFFERGNLPINMNSEIQVEAMKPVVGERAPLLPWFLLCSLCIKVNIPPRMTPLCLWLKLKKAACSLWPMEWISQPMQDTRTRAVQAPVGLAFVCFGPFVVSTAAVWTTNPRLENLGTMRFFCVVGLPGKSGNVELVFRLFICTYIRPRTM